MTPFLIILFFCLTRSWKLLVAAKWFLFSSHKVQLIVMDICHRDPCFESDGIFNFLAISIVSITQSSDHKFQNNCNKNLPKQNVAANREKWRIGAETEKSIKEFARNWTMATFFESWYFCSLPTKDMKCSQEQIIERPPGPWIRPRKYSAHFLVAFKYPRGLLRS